ncbi:MAG: arabinofuranosyltransferase [Planctomycetota bacterium]|jgi:arabinofuranosyltransferase
MSESRGSSKLPPLLLLALAIAIAWIVPVEYGEPPQDDAYISYIYARNFARGEGLVFNAGEPAVEGYTNYLWTIFIGWGYRAGIDPELIAPRIGLAITLLTVLAIFLLARRLGATAWFAAMATLLFATRPTLGIHAMGGMETPLFGLLVVLALITRIGDGGNLKRQWLGSFIIALAALTRPEGVMLFALLELSALFESIRAKRPITTFIRETFTRAVPFLLIVGAHVAWRRVTYGDWVPNTFHAKVEPSLQTFGDGWKYVSGGLIFFGPLFILLPYFVGFAEKHAIDRRRCLFIATVFTVYIVYVGGDYIPSYRFLWPIMPMWSVLLAGSLTKFCATNSKRTAIASVAFIALLAGHTTHEYLATERWPGLELRHQQLVGSGQLLDRVLPKEAWIAVTAAGRVPYFADRRTLDMMGLSDAHIGKRASMQKIPELAGHLKGDGKYVLDCQPDLIIFLQLMVGQVPLAQFPDWPHIARTNAFGVSERELAKDPRFLEEYNAYSLPLNTDGNSWLNVFARKGAFAGNLPQGSLTGKDYSSLASSPPK